jgi:hypothetical protein
LLSSPEAAEVVPLVHQSINDLKPELKWEALPEKPGNDRQTYSFS